MTDPDLFPVIIGAGQSMRPVPDDLDNAFGPVDLGGDALDRAFADARMTDRALDVCFAVRLFGDSGPAFPNPFGGSDNVPASICARAGATAGRYVYGTVGGQSPQNFVAEAARLLMDEQVETVAIVGAEAIANIKAAGRAGAKPDWTEKRDEPVEDRGLFGAGGTAATETPPANPLDGFGITAQAAANRVDAPALYYGLMETARRAALGETKEQYAARMAELWEGFAKLAADNPFAHVRHAPSGEEIVTPGPTNPMIASPYTKAMVARDGINLGAAVILTTYGRAKAMGVSDVTFLHAHDQCTEPPLLTRARLDRAEAQERVLNSVGRDADLYDLYSCFPVVPLEAKRILGLDDDAVMTLTGGLPFFGGPGNNYSLHGIAEAHHAVRGTNKIAVVYANGGQASKHSVGRYGGTPPEAVNLLCSENPAPSVEVEDAPNPSGRIASYTVSYKRGEPTGVIVIGETEGGKRFYARGDVDDARRFIQDDPIGEGIATETKMGMNRIVSA